MDLAEYAAVACPPLSLDAITAYQPKRQQCSDIAATVSRLHDFEDDGHAIKLARATAVCHALCRKYEDRDWLVIKAEDAWLKVLNMIVDSVQGPGKHWVRTAGQEETWEVSSAPRGPSGRFLTLGLGCP